MSSFMPIPPKTSRLFPNNHQNSLPRLEKQYSPSLAHPQNILAPTSLFVSPMFQGEPFPKPAKKDNHLK
jgi:hypothetical protein